MAADVTAGFDDSVLPFAVPDLDVRGRVVRLGASIDTVLARHDYPEPVSRVLGEAAALTVLLGTALKFEGRFQLQTKSDGAIPMMVVDFTAPDNFRAVAHIDEAKLVEAVALDQLSTGDLLGEGHLAMTIDQGSATTRYQGIVPLTRQSLEEAAHQYFRQSEQIPTRVRLAVGTVTTGGRPHWRAGGILVQFMPHSPERLRAADIHPGDVPEGHEILAGNDPDGVSDDAWMEARSLVETVEDHELLDPTLASERLLYRLFHERGARVFEPVVVHEACRCSRERVLSMLRGFSPEDRKAMIADDGKLGVTCEFCSRRYSFEPSEVEQGVTSGL
ncbi:Hsp33 family molecular chaperone [Bosea sp. SSUT16]|jgi:molecular chaperone Hsp33|uniref:Hsp33 family molecular chaperone n=1 Tax=Bosea spartocytisi TaxID=2773451 RepID=A0A927I0K2_9HYPH|nr:Hsp33 family molecular chaperone [Bosea spartocytisi]MBD3845488.1 Hsp33 family molecular chaperone [Bosea spartocytisi]MCT4472659.1 Hsp33 family molecular chaperone [Bosea spartocytisi]